MTSLREAAQPVDRREEPQDAGGDPQRKGVLLVRAQQGVQEEAVQIEDEEREQQDAQARRAPPYLPHSRHQEPGKGRDFHRRTAIIANPAVRASWGYPTGRGSSPIPDSRYPPSK